MELEKHRHAAVMLAPGRLGNGIMEHDPVVSLLTSFIIIYTPDFLDLDNPSRVMEVQAMFAGVLLRYLRSKNDPGHEEIFRSSMLASSYCRELSEFRVRALERMASRR